MKKIILAVGLLVLVVVGWLAYKGHEIYNDEQCREINYQLGCALAWTEYRANPTLDNKPLCDSGELSIRQFMLLTNKSLELECPAIKSR